MRILPSVSGREERSGAVHSIQRAELRACAEKIEGLAGAAGVKRVEEAYWSFFARVSLGLVRVHDRRGERSIVILASPLRMLTFGAPEYELAAERAAVRRPIVGGLLLARAGRGAQGRLQLAVTRRERALGLEVEVADFHPAIARAFGARIYGLTQLRMHVFLTNAFLRSLVRGRREPNRG